MKTTVGEGGSGRRNKEAGREISHRNAKLQAIRGGYWPNLSSLVAQKFCERNLTNLERCSIRKERGAKGRC